MLRMTLDKLTKSALKELLEDMMISERERQLPMHKRGEKKRKDKDSSTEDADEEAEKLADLSEETRGSGRPIEMEDDDVSEEGQDMAEDAAKKSRKKAKKA